MYEVLFFTYKCGQAWPVGKENSEIKALEIVSHITDQG